VAQCHGKEGCGKEERHMRYRVYYGRPPVFSGVLFAQEYIKVIETEAIDLDHLFKKMQGEGWSPNGEANDLIIAAGLSHTSMSVGDMAEEIKTGKVWFCDFVGWKEVQRKDLDERRVDIDWERVAKVYAERQEALANL